MIELVYDNNNGLEVPEAAIDVWVAEAVERYRKYSESPEYYLKLTAKTLPMVLAFLEAVRAGIIPHTSAALSSRVDGLLFLTVILKTGEVPTFRVNADSVVSILVKDDKLTIINK